MLKLPDVKVTESVSVPAAATGAVRVSHCRVNGVIGSEIRFTLLLPDKWNKKFLMGGGGGFVGSISNQALRFVNDGYATVGTDTGHQGAGFTDATWALDNLEPTVLSSVVPTNIFISPDGQWLAYQSNESGRFEIYLTRIDGTGAVIHDAN